MEGKKKTTTIDDKTNNKEKKEKMKARAGGMDMVGDDYARDYSAFDEKDKDKRIAGVRDDDEDKGKGKDDEKDKHDEDGGGGGDRERRLESSIGAGIDVPGNDDSGEGESASLYHVSKEMIIRSLAVHGKWVTNNPNAIKLSESESFQLFMRSASVAFLFEHAWLLAPKQHGKYLHILKDLMEKLGAKAIKPVIAKVTTLSAAKREFRDSVAVSPRPGKVVVLMEEY